MEFFFNYINYIFLSISIIVSIVLYLIYKSTQSRQLLNYTSNVWTSFGILGTFLCIVHAFSPEEGTKIKWDDIDALVKTIIPAFETSIIGVIGAIITSIAIKWIYAVEDKKEVDAYNRSFGGKNPEQHIGLLSRYMSSIDDKLGDVGSDTFAEKITKFFEASGIYHNALLEELKQEHSEMLQESKQQQALATRMIDNFTKTLKDFYDGLYADEQQRMEEITNRYLAGIDNVIKSTHGTIKEKFETVFSEHAESIRKLMENEEALFMQMSDKFVGSINTTSDNIGNAISEMGDKQIIELKGVTENTTSKLSEISDNTKKAVTQMASDNQKSIRQFAESMEENIGNISAEFLSLFNSLKSEFESLAKMLPCELTNIKSSFIETIKTITEEKYNNLAEENKIFVAELLSQVQELEKNASNLSMQTQTQWLSTIQNELGKLLNNVDDNVKTNTTLLRETTNDVGNSLSGITTTLRETTADYKNLSALIASLVESLQKETNATEVYANSMQSTNLQLQNIQNLLSEVANKNLQLRQELAQWKRTHKRIKVNPDTGEKECPNCHEWNPVEASYCRKCATSFWECKPVVDKKESSKDKA